MKTPIILFAISLAVVLALNVSQPWATRRRFRRMAQQPDRPDEAGFIAALRCKGIPDDVSRCVFRGFRKWSSAVVPDFRVKTSDLLYSFLPIVAYDKEDILDDILQESRRSFPQDRRFPFSKETTVEDVAKFIANCERIDESEAQQCAAPLPSAPQSGPSEGAR